MYYSKILLLVSFCLLSSCSKVNFSFKAKNVNRDSLIFTNQIVDSIVKSGIKSNLKLTLKTNSLEGMTKNPAAYLELQDYIVRRIEQEGKPLASSFELGISFNFSKETKELGKILKSVSNESISNITNNVDFVTASVNSNSDSVNKLTKYLENLGVDLQKASSNDNELIVNSGFRFSQCEKALEKNKNSNDVFILIVDYQKISTNIGRNITQCLTLTKKYSTKVEVIISPNI